MGQVGNRGLQGHLWPAESLSAAPAVLPCRSVLPQCLVAVSCRSVLPYISRMKTFQATLPHDRSKMIIKIIFCTTDLYQVGNRGLQGHLLPAAATLTANFDEKKLQTECKIAQ